MIDARHARRSLEAIRGRLRARLGFTADDRGNAGDLADQAARAYDEHVDRIDSERTRARLVEVLDALLRIDRGEYGACTRCGEPIGKKRIEAIPETPYCLSCAETLERQQQRSVARLIEEEEDDDV